MDIQNAIRTALAVTLAIVLNIAAFEHLRNQPRFLLAILRYDIVGGNFAANLPIVLVVLQGVLSISLLFQKNQRQVALITGAVFLLFCIAQVSVLRRGISVDCGCFGTMAETSISVWTVSRTSVFFVMAITLAVMSKREVDNEFDKLAV